MQHENYLLCIKFEDNPIIADWIQYLIKTFKNILLFIDILFIANSLKLRLLNNAITKITIK